MKTTTKQQQQQQSRPSEHSPVVVVVVIFLTLTDPLRIQPWSQVRGENVKTFRVGSYVAKKYKTSSCHLKFVCVYVILWCWCVFFTLLTDRAAIILDHTIQHPHPVIYFDNPPPRRGLLGGLDNRKKIRGTSRNNKARTRA